VQSVGKSVNRIQLSVILVNYNTKDFTKNCITSIGQNIAGISYEIIVVDNNSADNSVEFLNKLFGNKVQVIPCQHNYGFAIANNIGVVKSRGEFVLFLNTDAIISNDIINKLVSYLVNNPEVSAASCRLLNSDGSIQLNNYKMWSLSLELMRRSKIKLLIGDKVQDLALKALRALSLKDNNIFTYLNSSNQQIATVEVNNISGACFLVRREILDSVGCFDENYFLYYEDVDLCKKIIGDGGKIVLLPDLGVVHLVGASDPNKQFGFVQLEELKSCFYYFQKHHGRISNAILKNFMFGLHLLQYQRAKRRYGSADNKKNELFFLKSALRIINES